MKRYLVGPILASMVSTAAVQGDCTADANQDGVVNANDILIALSAWGPCQAPCGSDTDDSGTVDVIDVLAIIDGWGDCESEGLELIFEQNFEHRQAGAYDEEMLDEDWKAPTWSQGIDDGRVSIVETDDGQNMALAVLYPEGEYGTSNTGGQWKLLFEESHECVVLSYRLRFESPFDFVKGGKLPGLIGGEGNTGGGIPDGTDGWSARMMWRTDGDIMNYVYHPDQPENYGENMYWQSDGQTLQFIPGQWHDVKHEITMNTPGLNDGSIRGWLNGELVLERTDMRFRDIADFAIDGLYFSTFFGGGSSSWSTTKDETILFDDFTIQTDCH